MKITPIDIRQQQFGRTLRGLDAREVDSFLNLVSDELETNLKENNRLREELARMKDATEKDRKRIVSELEARYEHQSDPRYAAARLWVDEIIMPEDTREVLVRCLELCDHQTTMPAPRFGVLQV